MLIKEQNFDNVSFSSPISLSLENQVIFNYKIYPNPTSGLINIQGNTSELRITIFDILGKELINRYVSDKLDIGSLEKGIYIMNIYDGASTSKYKIVKELKKSIKINNAEKVSKNNFFSNKRIVFTGSLSKLSRDEAKYKAKINGAKILSTVSHLVSIIFDIIFKFYLI